jgi:hypothetical protein
MQCLAYAEAEAVNLIRENLNVVLALVDALVASSKGKLTGQQVDTIIAATIATQAVEAERIRRAEWRERERNAVEFLNRLIDGATLSSLL